ncbi:MAG: shikimate kinase AroK [Gammaproteobacteria bacterium]|nr:shikimate kinase AroK [Gammaproteobacteria bacterium]
MKYKSNIFFVGPMGAGKTTIGRAVSSQMGLEFFDTDQEIERRTGADIPWIFDMEGEVGFRDREESVIKELTAKKGVVLATGGGAVLRPDNRKFLASRGRVVYLKASVDDLLSRTRRDKQRPLLQNTDRHKVLTELVKVREPLYLEVADVTVLTAKNSVKDVVAEIVDLLAGLDAG